MTKTNLDDGTVPFFAEEEHTRYRAHYGHRDLKDLGKLVLRVKNAEADAALADHFSSMYLITNFLLMSRAQKLILKIVQLESHADARAKLYTQVNSLRYLLLGDYSALDNFGAWQTNVQEYLPLSENFSAKLKSISDFLSVSEIAKNNSSARSADTMLSMFDGTSYEDQGIHLKESKAWQLCLETDTVDYKEYLSQAIYSDAFSVHVSSTRDALVIEVDASQSSLALEGWMAFLENLFEENPLGLAL